MLASLAPALLGGAGAGGAGGAPEVRAALLALMADTWQRLEVARAAAAATVAGGAAATANRKRARGADAPSPAPPTPPAPSSQQQQVAAGAGGDADAADAAARLEAALFVMLADDAPDVSRAAADFWHSLLPKAPAARLAELLARASSRDAASGGGTGAGGAGACAGLAAPRERLLARWAQAAAALLLRLPRGAPGWDEAMFDQPLSRCAVFIGQGGGAPSCSRLALLGSPLLQTHAHPIHTYNQCARLCV